MITSSKSLASVARLASSVFVLGACAAEAEPAEEAAAPAATEVEEAPALSGTLVGAGASSQGSAAEAWIAGFHTINPDVTVSYDPIGSGGGRETFQS